MAQLQKQKGELQNRQVQLQTRNDRLKLLLELTNSMVSKLEVREIFLSMSADLRRVLQCDVAGLAVPNTDERTFRQLVIDFPESRGLLRPDFVAPMEGTLTGSVFRTGKSWVGCYHDLAVENVVASREGLMYGCHIPLVGRCGVLGVLGLCRRTEVPFSRDDVDFAAHVAREMSIAVENALSHGELKMAKEGLRKAFDEIRILKDQLYRENLVLRSEVETTSMFEEIVGVSPAIQHVLSDIAKVSPTDSTVLIIGETGTGKELVARAIHKRSPRADRAFVPVNCAALPTSLIGSELFGYEKGAFTGANQRRLGRFEVADGGTIFLDEIGDLPAETQIALLRVLQERQFERVGGNKSVPVNVRVIAATHRDLRAAVAAGTFRTDLFYRLNVLPIELPPLRARSDDIPLLVDYFVARYARKAGKEPRPFDRRTLEVLQSYNWPGNIRELQNIIERSIILCDGETLSLDEGLLSQTPVRCSHTRLHERLVDFEKELIESALSASKGQIWGPGGAAVKLGLPPSTLDTKLKILGINKYRFKSMSENEKDPN